MSAAVAGSYAPGIGEAKKKSNMSWQAMIATRVGSD